MRLKTVIVDDEPLARERLRFLLSRDEEIEILAECRNGHEALSALQRFPADVLFLDIQMPAMNGFNLIEQLGDGKMPVTVFVTAHNHYALKAFEVSALDYLTKPVDPLRLEATLARIKGKIASDAALATQSQLTAVLDSLRNHGLATQDYPQRLIVPHGAKEVFVDVTDIEWIEAADYYSCLHVGSKSYLLRQPIKQLAGTLDPNRFVRIHRSALVNIDQVKEMFREGQGEGSVMLKSGQRLKMSKSGWQNLLAMHRKDPR